MPATPNYLLRRSPAHSHARPALAALFSLLAMIAPPAARAQTAPATSPALAIAPTTAPTTAPAADVQIEGITLKHSTIVALSPPTTVPSTTLPADATSIAQPFVAVISGDKVYIRSGPGATYYEVGQLTKGDLVYVVGISKGWYKILPPNGTYCLIAKELVDADPADTSAGTVKSDYVNVRAGSANNKLRDPFAVLSVIRKGAKLKILGSNDKYYEVAPPDGADVYVSPQFLRQTTAEYVVATLKLNPGATGPSQTTVTAPSSPPALANPTPAAPPAAHSDSGTTPGSGTGPAVVIGPKAEFPSDTTQPATAVPTPVPAVTFSQSATDKFNELNTRYQAEGRKPLLQQNVDDLLTQYKALLAMDYLSPSVKLGTESRITSLEKVAAIQRLNKENEAATATLTQQREALEDQYASAQRAIADYQKTSPMLAEGTLQSSTIVAGKYALVNPATGRVVAYVDPKSDIDIGSLIGKYIGVRGISSQAEGSDITVIRVSNATLMAAPVPTSRPANP